MQVLRIIAVLSVCTFMLMYSSPLPAQKPGSREYQLKAVFLFNFTQFVDWPSSSFGSEDSPLVIGVIGENPFGNFLEQTVSGENKNGHPVVVQYYQDEEEALSCHILFINTKEPKKHREVIAAMRGKNILTVSDVPDFTNQGGIVRFFTNNNKIKLQINLDACRATDIVPSSKLLRLAEIIESPETH
jgi:hypothetical protein